MDSEDPFHILHFGGSDGVVAYFACRLSSIRMRHVNDVMVGEFNNQEDIAVTLANDLMKIRPQGRA